LKLWLSASVSPAGRRWPGRPLLHLAILPAMLGQASKKCHVAGAANQLGPSRCNNHPRRVGSALENLCDGMAYQPRGCAPARPDHRDLLKNRPRAFRTQSRPPNPSRSPWQLPTLRKHNVHRTQPGGRSQPLDASNSRQNPHPRTDAWSLVAILHMVMACASGEESRQVLRGDVQILSPSPPRAHVCCHDNKPSMADAHRPTHCSRITVRRRECPSILKVHGQAAGAGKDAEGNRPGDQRQALLQPRSADFPQAHKHLSALAFSSATPSQKTVRWPSDLLAGS